ncbi:MAG: aquaporin [Chthoniobacterales bacterium]
MCRGVLDTFALVFAGTGGIIIDEVSGGAVSLAGIALTFGLIVMAMIYTFGDISGAHLNPAVTLGFVGARRMPASEGATYFIWQPQLSARWPRFLSASACANPVVARLRRKSS